MGQLLVFYDPSFPYAGARPDAAALEALSQHAMIVNAQELAQRLPEADSIIYLHAPYVPKAAWSSMLQHLRQGKGLVVSGGAPFKLPVYEAADEAANGHAGLKSWMIEPEQTGYHQQLNIHEAIAIDPSPIAKLSANTDIPLLEGNMQLFTIEPTYGLVLHVTKVDDQPGQLGSSGPMDAHIYPLMVGTKEGAIKREIAAPAVLIENTKGDYAGGSWIFINQQLRPVFWQDGGASLLMDLGRHTALGVTELWLKTNYASYEPGDQVTVSLQLQKIANPKATVFANRAGSLQQAGSGFISGATKATEWTFRLRLLKANDSTAVTADPNFSYDNELFTELWQGERKLTASRELDFARVAVPIPVAAGFHIVECNAISSNGEVRKLRQGYWGIDMELLQQGEMLVVDRDYFWKNGRPLPIVGMTYMTSDVARKFLLMPNVAVWDRDMAQMKRAGINLIRTGIWTAWRSIMFVDGHPYEEVLRAIDAFVLTAKRYELEVTFNFFAFTPEAWDGVNPYLDPRSVEAQKRFLAAIVSRHKDSTNVHWDLINEPTMFDPLRLFSGPRSCQDRFERQAFTDWLKQRHGTIRLLQERWNMTPEELPAFEAAQLPEPEQINFKTTENLAKKGGPWLDYTLFTMEMHNHWAAQLIQTIRAIQPKQLVTVGQDEGLGAQRPSPFFYAEAVDYTTVHSWWKMDDLVWDGVFTKAADKPNVIQETGIMYVETPDGRAKRNEAELRNILERKYAYAFSTGGAGAVQWIWNTNFYMNNINESNIGALRADGTEKPEADVSYDFGQFMESIRDLFVDRKLEEIAVVFPYSNDFSNRKLAYESTTHLVRTLSYNMNVHVRGLSEYHLDSLSECMPRLVIVPSAHNFSTEALDKLIAHISSQGGVLLITGPVGLDEYWRPQARLADTIGDTVVANLLREELLEINGRKLPVSFGGARIADANKQLPVIRPAIGLDGTGTGISTEAAKQTIAAASRGHVGAIQLTDVQIGGGRLIWCPLPVELNNRLEPLIELYKHAMAAAGVTQELEWLQGSDLPGVYGRKLSYRDGALFIFVSEYAVDAEISVKDPVTGVNYSFQLESERTVMFASNSDGDVISIYRPEEVEVKAG
ncbi:beta-galactosidase [Paenibacillus agricola]|uniref:Glycoside hydrolase n=1 Tax=Paenibacillus agricola TaxID=2716264 RepID=A0ABX0J0I0_9BACL|nr:beta-galactosidase [Paenibacillus agricola]NHN29193.1 glycoside hydrolase [Paenibacillus agricola]